MANATAWSKEELLLVAEKWKAGESANRISEVLTSMGVKRSRNSVIGKLNRMGLSNNRTAESRKLEGMISNGAGNWSVRAKPEAKRMNHETAKKAIESEPLTETAVTFLERRWNQCAWPLGESSRDMMCCGGPTTERADGSMTSYCLDHFIRSASIIRQAQPLAPKRKYTPKPVKRSGIPDLCALLSV